MSKLTSRDIPPPRRDSFLDDLLSDAPPTTRRMRANPTAMISGNAAERALIIALQVAAWALVGLSVVGTFYGWQGRDVPITAPWLIIGAIQAAPRIFLAAVAVQGLLALLQWGSRHRVFADPRWWALYLAGLAPSVWWNWTSYGDPLIAVGVPWMVALGLVLAGDILPEFALVD